MRLEDITARRAALEAEAAIHKAVETFVSFLPEGVASEVEVRNGKIVIRVDLASHVAWPFDVGGSAAEDEKDPPVSPFNIIGKQATIPLQASTAEKAPVVHPVEPSEAREGHTLKRGPWSEDELAAFERLAAEGKSSSEIGEALCRAPGSINLKLHKWREAQDAKPAGDAAPKAKAPSKTGPLEGTLSPNVLSPRLDVEPGPVRTDPAPPPSPVMKAASGGRGILDDTSGPERDTPPPVPRGKTKQGIARDIEARLAEIDKTPDPMWSRKNDLRLVEIVCRGDGLDAAAAMIGMTYEGARARWGTLFPSRPSLDEQTAMIAALKARAK